MLHSAWFMNKCYITPSKQLSRTVGGEKNVCSEHLSSFAQKVKKGKECPHRFFGQKIGYIVSRKNSLFHKVSLQGAKTNKTFLKVEKKNLIRYKDLI